MEMLTPEQQEQLAKVWRLRMEGIKSAKKLQNDEAEALYWQALRLHEEVLGEENPGIAESLNQLVFFYSTQDRRVEAAVLLQRSLALLRRKPGPEQRRILQTLDVLAIRAQQLERYEDAEAYFKQVLIAREDLLGLNHLRVAGTLEKYADLLHQMGHEARARAMEERAKAIRGK